MKATGIVRRIDDLGRVVIPKEIRRTMRIREGDPLEIYTDAGGEVIFKKYSPIGDLSQFAEQYAESLSKVVKLGVLICDRDHCVAVSGVPKREIIDRRITPELERIMEMRKAYVASTEGDAFCAVDASQRRIRAAMPIIAAGDISGAVVLIESDATAEVTDTDISLITVAAGFLGRQMEE